jgi:hypothetical protein
MTRVASDDRQFFASLKGLELALFCAAATSIDAHMAPCSRRLDPLEPLSRKQAKALVLRFHPDKTKNLSPEVQAVCNQVFVQFIAPGLETQDTVLAGRPSTRPPARKPAAAAAAAAQPSFKPAYKPAPYPPAPNEDEFAYEDASFRSASPWDVDVDLMFSRASRVFSTLEKEMGLFDSTKRRFGVPMGASRRRRSRSRTRTRRSRSRR